MTGYKHQRREQNSLDTTANSSPGPRELTETDLIALKQFNTTLRAQTWRWHEMRYPRRR